ncbi:MAG: DNA-binding protein WhiA [Thermaerobacter sp.]|nr:DNA-binding protein WhiA [Thermaerobacter sp.]
MSDSFSRRTKEELARQLPRERCCRLAELAALVRAGGGVAVAAGEPPAAVLHSDSAAVVRKAFLLGKGLFGLSSLVLARRRRRLDREYSYYLRLEDPSRSHRVLRSLGLWGAEAAHAGIPPRFLRRGCCRRSFLRGLFLAAGSLAGPGREYHLEFDLASPAFAAAVADLLRTTGLAPHLGQRGEDTRVYLKEGDDIARFLVLAGAHGSLLDFESTRAFKEVKNRINRVVNCETANLNKALEAGLRQAEGLRLLQRTMGLDALPASLREVATLRLRHPEASLGELGELLHLGKSGINHRLRRLEGMVRSLRRGGTA